MHQESISRRHQVHLRSYSQRLLFLTLTRACYTCAAQTEIALLPGLADCYHAKITNTHWGRVQYTEPF
jgi:hypothetical protein